MIRDPKYIGTTQSTRLENRTNPLEIAIDDRPIENLLSILYEYASLFHFKESNSDDSKDWQAFFNYDLTSILALSITKDLAQAQFDFNLKVKEFSRATDGNIQIEALEAMISVVNSLLSEFNNLRDRLLKIQYPDGEIEKFVYFDIEAYYEQSVLDYIYELHAIILGAIPHAEKQKSAFNLGYQIIESSPEDVSQEDIPNKLESVFIRLRILFNNLLETSLAIRDLLIPYFVRSLSQKDDHQPHIGLLLGFLEQYKKLQTSINKVPENYLHFYYIDFLKQKKRKHIAPYAYVSFAISPYVENKTIPENTILLASLDKDGLPHRFSTKYPVNVGRYTLSDIKTLYFDRGRRETLTNKYSIITESFMAPYANSQDGKGSPFNSDKLPAWPTFGEGQIEKEPSLRNMIESELGFSVASSVLMLGEGKRSIKIRLNFTEESVTEIVRLFKDIASKEHKKSTMLEVFYKIFSTKSKKRNITILLTSAKGWHKVDPQTILIFQDGEEEWDPRHICISFNLSPMAPPIIPFNEHLHSGKYISGSQPILMLLLNNDREPYLYSFLQKLVIETIEIDARVENVRNLSVYNEYGLIDNSQPFYPFGPTPVKNSYFLLGNREIFSKKLDEFELNIDWFDLPETAGQFNQKYEVYERRYDEFKVQIGNLNDGQFVMEDNSRPLFMTKEIIGSDKLSDEGLFTKYTLDSGDLKSLGFNSSESMEIADQFSTNANAGFLKFVLDEPEDGFGQQKYQEILAKQMLKNARLINKAFVEDENEDSPELGFPEMPLIPMVSNIHINYKASDVIELTQDAVNFQEINHIHPFGYEKIYPNIKYRDRLPYLLPQYEEDGYLLLGLKNCKKAEIISLLFQMTPVYYQDRDQYILPIIRWQYLTYNNNWKLLQGENILRDETDSFTKSGVIQIKIPSDISTMSQIMEPNKFWLRVSATGDIQLLNHTLAIYPNATLTRWVDQSDPSGLNTPFPPESIIALDNKIHGVTSMIQPYESFGGKAEESNIEFYTRISERLRHKNRGWTAWDIERLVLNQFDDIEQVKCISGVTESNAQRYEYLDLHDDGGSFEVSYVNEMEDFISSKVIVVIVPKKLKYLKEHLTIANFRKLEQVKSFLKDKMSPFVTLKVRNPEFEYIRISCDIKFVDTGNEGLYIARLKREITKFICPWYVDESDALEFNKELQVQALKDYIKSLDFVVFITRFSVIQIIENGFQYHIVDSAASQDLTQILKPYRPWSTFIPDQDHLINIVEEEIEVEPTSLQPPVKFKNEYNILSKARILKLKSIGGQKRRTVKENNLPFNPFTLEI